MSNRLAHPSRLFLASLLVSLVLHGLVAAGFIWLRFPRTSQTSQTPTVHLEIAQVDPSYADTPDETAAAAPESAPMPQTPSLPEPIVCAAPCAPQPDTTDLPKPDEPHEQFEETSITHHSPPVAPRQAKVDAPPKPRRNIKPDYPKESRQRGEQGDVTLEIAVNAQGTVDDVHLVKSSGFPLLDEAAIKAVRAARFTPAMTDGKPVSSTARLTLSFKLK